jgi:hypothetical protein
MSVFTAAELTYLEGAGGARQRTAWRSVLGSSTSPMTANHGKQRQASTDALGQTR